jgi:hypothetical protein
MFGRNRRRRFEQAVSEEIAYMLSLHGDPIRASAASAERARRPNIGSSRVRVLEEAAARMAAAASTPEDARAIA